MMNKYNMTQEKMRIKKVLDILFWSLVLLTVLITLVVKNSLLGISVFCFVFITLQLIHRLLKIPFNYKGERTEETEEY